MKKVLLAFMVLALVPPTFADGEVIDKNAAPGASTDGSLWSNDSNPLKDRTARKPGDLVTILISESSVATFSATTATNKKDENSAVQNVISGLFSFLSPNKEKTSSASGSSQGGGNTNQSGTLRARLTAEVKAVTSTGNLILEGSRKITINKETQLFKLTGIVRRDDIAPDNTVLSESVAQAEISVFGKGQIADRTRKGLITTIIDWIF
jgi:flagellar L-ring protein FlgH